jgi:hypothetical protein
LCEESLCVLEEVCRGEDQGAGHAHHVVQVDYLPQEQFNHFIGEKKTAEMITFVVLYFIIVINITFFKRQN